jgi:predicted secreted protein
MLSVAAGVPFEVALGGAPGGGCLWEPLHLPDGVHLLATRFPDKHDAGGGTQVFELRADQPGAHQLRFVLKRRWESAPIESRVVEIDVR